MSTSPHNSLVTRLCASAMMLVVALPLASTAAQDVKQADLRQLKSQLQHEVLLAVLPEKKAYREQLLALEKRFAAEQDFESALRSRNERLAVEKELSTIEKDLARLQSAHIPPPPSQIELKYDLAKLTGVQKDESQGFLKGWDSPEGASTWLLPDVPPGGYEVVLQSTGEGGAVTLKESYYTLEATLKPSYTKPASQNLGTLRIKDGRGPLTLTVNFPEKCKGLRVYGIVLIPCAR